MSTETDLTSKQRKYLKGLAHELEPVVRIGRASLSDGVRSETQRALESHELIKVRIDQDDPEDRRELARDLAAQTGASLVTTIGKIAILYRQRAEEPAIRLPR